MIRISTLDISTLGVAFIIALAGFLPAQAGTVLVSPISLELTAPLQTGAITLKAGSDEPAKVQLRIMKWSISDDGHESLEPTNDVVISPPFATVMPDTPYIARVVRLSNAPIHGEENYRILIDEILVNKQTSVRKIAFNFAVRQSMPLFFRETKFTPVDVEFKLVRSGSQILLVGHNTGDEHARLESLTVKDSSGKTVWADTGLSGYILGHGRKSWALPKIPPGVNLNAPLTITANLQDGLKLKTQTAP